MEAISIGSMGLDLALGGGVRYSMPVTDILTFIASAVVIAPAYRRLDRCGAGKVRL